MHYDPHVDAHEARVDEDATGAAPWVPEGSRARAASAAADGSAADAMRGSTPAADTRYGGGGARLDGSRSGVARRDGGAPEREARTPLKRIAAALRRERVRSGVSLSELAKRAGIAKSTLSQVESGSANPNLETLWALSVALEVPLSRLVEPPGSEVRVIRAPRTPGGVGFAVAPPGADGMAPVASGVARPGRGGASAGAAAGATGGGSGRVPLGFAARRAVGGQTAPGRHGGVASAGLVVAPGRAAAFERSGAAGGAPARWSGHTAMLLSASPSGARRDVYLIHVEPGFVRDSEAHGVGTVEHIVVASGRVLTGPRDAPVELGPGDYVSYPGDVPHTCEALTPATCVLLMEHL